MRMGIVFTVIDLAFGYHQMRLKIRSRQYTAFRTNNEIYQWKVAPMGLAGMPGTWTRLMRTTLAKLKFVVVYLDDICIFSPSLTGHYSHIKEVLEVLRTNQRYARKSKCTFAKPSVEFLGHIISNKELKVDPRKVAAIASWSTPQNAKDLQRFIGASWILQKVYQRLR